MKRNGFVTVGMLVMAGSLGLMLMARHSAAPAEVTPEAGLAPVELMQPLRPFDEHFVADGD